MATVEIVRLDKDTRTITAFRNADVLIAAFMADFGIKTKATAYQDLFNIYVGESHFVQNIKIAYCLRMDAERSVADYAREEG